jgi:hypothetical protein
VLDEHLHAESADLAASFLSPPHRAVARQLVEGQEVLLAMTWRRDAGGPARLAVTAEPPAGSDDEQIEQAVALARRSDVAGAEPAYPFGHGLGYTTWDYVALDAPATAPAGAELRRRVHLRNSGARRGKEVVQAYLDRADSAVERPVRWPAGFAVVTAAAGETATAELRIAPRAFEHWCERHHAWHTEAGRFRLRVGRSIADLHLTASVELTAMVA